MTSEYGAINSSRFRFALADTGGTRLGCGLSAREAERWLSDEIDISKASVL
jgi:hypothetical protein